MQTILDGALARTLYKATIRGCFLRAVWHFTLPHQTWTSQAKPNLVQGVAIEPLETWMLTFGLKVLKLHCDNLWWMQSCLLQLTLIRRAWWMSAASWLFHHWPSDSIFPIQKGPQSFNANMSVWGTEAIRVQFKHFCHTTSISGLFARKCHSASRELKT